MDADEDLVALFDENWSVSENYADFIFTKTLSLLTKNYDEISTKLENASSNTDASKNNEPGRSSSKTVPPAKNKKPAIRKPNKKKFSISDDLDSDILPPLISYSDPESEDSAVTRSNHKVEISSVNALRNESSLFSETIPSKKSNKTRISRKPSEKNVSAAQEKFPVQKLVDYSDSDDSDSASSAEHSGEKLDNFPTTTASSTAASRNQALHFCCNSNPLIAKSIVFTSNISSSIPEDKAEQQIDPLVENTNETEQPKKRGRPRKNLNETKPNTRRRKIELMEEAVMSLEDENIENTNEKKEPKKRGRPRKPK